MFDLYLQNGYPYPYPENISEAEQERISENVKTLVVTGVVNFQWLHTVTVEFATQDDFNAAMELTGWTRWDDLVLEAPTSAADGYDHPAIIVKDAAYCGFLIVPHDPARKREFVEFVARARVRAKELFAYPDLIEDHEERTKAAYEAGQDPEEFAQWLGDKYGLTYVDDY